MILEFLTLVLLLFVLTPGRIIRSYGAAADDSARVAYERLPGRPLDPFAMGGESPDVWAPLDPLEPVGKRILDYALAAAEPSPPTLEGVVSDLAPQKLWQPTWLGVGPFFSTQRCLAHEPAPRLWARSLNELIASRSRDLGQEQLIEPKTARQAWAQFASVGVRSKKDTYTRAAVNARGLCAHLRTRVPKTTNF